MRDRFNTTKMADPASTQLSYWTDRGGYYYWFANPPNKHGPVGVPQDKFKVCPPAVWLQHAAAVCGHPWMFSGPPGQ